MTMCSVELKGPKDEIHTLHVNAWGVMPFGMMGPGMMGPGMMHRMPGMRW